MSLLLSKTKISNVGPISDVELQFQGPGVYVITGKNNAGKTHALLALKYLLEGIPRGEENPLKNGEKSGEVVAWLGNGENGLEVMNGGGGYKYKISRRITPSGFGQVKVEYAGKDFTGELKNPRSILDRFLIDIKKIDPWAFIQMDDKSLLDTLLKIVTIPLDRNKLAEIAGFNSGVIWPDDDLDCIDQLHEKLYAMRTDTNRYLEKAKAVLADIVIPDEWQNIQPVKVLDLMEEKKALEDQEKANNAERKKLVDLKAEKDEKLTEFNNSMVNETAIITAALNKVAEYNRMVSDLEEQIKTTKRDGEVRRGIIQTDVEQINKNIGLQQFLIDAIVPVDYTKIDEKIKTADETNEWAGKVKNKKVQEAEVDKLSKQSIDYSLKMGKILEYKKELLSQTKFPCEGLSFADGKVMLGPVPFKKQGEADQLIAAFEILRAQDPELKVVLSFSETQMDEAHTKLLEDLAIKNGFQFLTCKVKEEKADGCFFIENGVCG